jgi:hypothetical protein
LLERLLYFALLRKTKTYFYPHFPTESSLWDPNSLKSG